MIVRTLLLLGLARTGHAGGWHATRTPIVCFAGGFGGTSTKTKGASISLSNKAKKLLKKHKNNVDAASTDYFRSQMETVESNSKDELHEARVAATWNTVAMFLPQDYARTNDKVEPYVERRLGHIVTACNGDQAVQLLDVGCGDGALVPYLGQGCEFKGLDVSSEMIELGRRRWPKHSFQVGSFPRSIPADAQYDTILFNGSLQFFPDTRKTLADAAARLKLNGRIVLSHVNGAKFVREECQSNPSVAVRNMPNKVSLLSMGELMGFEVLDKSKLLESVEFDQGLDGEDDQFYLVALQKLE